MSEKIKIEDFIKVDLRVGEILEVEKVPDTEKLLKLKVDMGPIIFPVVEGEEVKALERDIRQIVSGIALYFEDMNTLVGKKCMFVANLEPRMIRGLESNGMILAVSTDDGNFSLVAPSSNIPAGTRAK